MLVVVSRQKDAEEAGNSLQTWLVLEMVEHQQGRLLPHMDEWRWLPPTDLDLSRRWGIVIVIRCRVRCSHRVSRRPFRPERSLNPIALQVFRVRYSALSLRYTRRTKPWKRVSPHCFLDMCKWWVSRTGLQPNNQGTIKAEVQMCPASLNQYNTQSSDVIISRRPSGASEARNDFSRNKIVFLANMESNVFSVCCCSFCPTPSVSVLCLTSVSTLPPFMSAHLLPFLYWL